jgi:hypothetical protein
MSAVVIVAVGGAKSLRMEGTPSPLTRLEDKKAKHNNRLSKIALLLLLTLKKGDMAFRVSRGVS